MDNIIDGIASGIGSVVSKILASPLNFLSGKSCSSVCAPTWDFICYIENFCVSQLLKFAMVALLVYFVLLYFYLLYELGICKCMCWTSCKIVWGCISTWFSMWEFCCLFLFDRLHHVKRVRRRKDIEEHYSASTCDRQEDESTSSSSSSVSYNEVSQTGTKRKYRRDYKRDHLSRSLRPRNHQVRVGVSGDSRYFTRKHSAKWDDQSRSTRHIKVARTSKFARKGVNYRGSKHHKRR